MMEDMMNYKILLAAAINDILKLGQDFLAELIEIPPQKELGDFSLPCFKLINKPLANPFLIAKEIKKEFKNGRIILYWLWSPHSDRKQRGTRLYSPISS